MLTGADIQLHADKIRDDGYTVIERAADPEVVMGSKAVGEPPLMLAISVREAIRDAVAAFGNGGPLTFASPATPERVFFAVEAARAARAAKEIVKEVIRQ